MALTRISDNQIATATNAILTTLSFAQTASDLSTLVFSLPRGDTSERPGSPAVGSLRFNTEIDNAEVYVADVGTGTAGWTAVAGGGPSLGNDSVVRTNDSSITESITIGPTADSKFSNGMSSGPITIDGAAVTVTIEAGGSWSIV